jgi:alpha-mannosidase
MKKQVWLVAALAACFACVAQAQSMETIDKATQFLPPQSRETLNRLGQFDRLPAGQWRVHPGDLPHGESPSLDDSSWPVAQRGQEFGKDAVWFRRWIEVPANLHGYDLTGVNVWFQFDVRPTERGDIDEIVYFDGRRVALGTDLEKLELFQNARPGQRVLVAVKVLATASDKRFQGETEQVDFAPGRPNPQDLHDEILSVAILIPSISKEIPADQERLRQAIDKVDFKALDAGDQKRFDASLEQATDSLNCFRPMLSQVTIHLDGNSHIDAAWLWPRSETVDVVHRTFGTALQLMHEYPDYVYTQSAAQYNAWMADKYPPLNDEIAQRIREGRWEVVGGMWVEPDLNLPDGESTARSILIGKRWFLDHYGVDVRIGWNPDSFGYNWQLPQIYKKSGIDYFVTQKMSWNDTNQLPLKLFWWESPDGSKVLTYFPHGYGDRILNPVHFSAEFADARIKAPGLPEMMTLYGVGDHGGGPTRDMLDQGTHWMQPGMITPKMEFGTAQSYFSAIEKEIAPESKTWNYATIAQGYQYPPAPPAGEISIPTWKDELYLEYHRGVYTTQANMKRNLREAPEWTLNAEKVASLAWLDGNPYPSGELTEAWKKIAFNDFHDLAAGSGIAVIYRDAQKDFDQVRWATNEISSKSLRTISERIDTRVNGGAAVLVFNPLAWSRSGMVRVDVQMPSDATEVSVLDAHGNVLPSELLSRDAGTSTVHLLVQAHDVPSLGYELLHVVAGKREFASDLKAAESASGIRLENAALRVVVDPRTGCITSLYDRKSGFESIASGSCGNQLQTFHDLPKLYDAWNIDPGTYDHPPAIPQADSVKLIQQSPLRAIVRIVRKWQSSTFEQEIELDANSDEVEIHNDVDWHETHVLLKAAFPLSATAPFATYEIPFGTIERPTTRNNSWEKARFEVPAQNWADLGDGRHGLSLINRGKFGYDAVGNLLRLTLLRSPTSPDPNADRGEQRFSFALYPHAGDWKHAMTVRRGYEYNYGLTAAQVEEHAGALPAEHSFVSVSAPDVVLTAMKKAEDSNALVFHMYEWAGRQAQVSLEVPDGATGAVETNLLEKPDGDPLPLHGNRVDLTIHPYEIAAVRVDYPAAH